MRWLLVAISFCGAVCAVLSLAVSDEAAKPSLTIRLGPKLITNVNETKGIFCEGNNLQHPLEWLSPSGELVGKRSSNRRVNAGHRANETHLLGLFIANATLGDSGNWTCRSGDELNETITIYVAEKVKITSKETTLVGDEGRSIKLVCDAKGFPEPVVQWYKDYTILDVKELSSKYKLKHKKNHPQHVLEILDLTYLDIGTYVCRATQEKISHFDQKLFHLYVKHEPVITNEFSEREVFAIMHEIKNITCKAQGNPPPVYSWAKRTKDTYDDLIPSEQVYTSNDSTYSVLMLKVYKEEDLGQYKCSVENERGRKNFIFDVSVGNKPDPPTSVQVFDVKAFNITFNVTCETCLFDVEGSVATNPNNLTVQGYNFQLVPCQEGYAVPDWRNATEFVFNVDNTTETLFTVSPLVNATEYHARVATRNAAGLSDWFPIHPNPKTLDKNNAAALNVSLALFIITFFTTLCY